MPSSNSETIPFEIEFIRKYNPNLESVLDVGIGFGKGGFLIREYMDVKDKQRYKLQDWKVKIVGIDIFDGYVSDIQRLIYNQIIIGDVFDVLPKLGKFDLVILGDVIEHFEKHKGRELLKEVFKHTENVVVTTPYGFQSQPPDKDNKYMEHKSGWKIKDFEEYKIIDTYVVPKIRKPNKKALVVYLRKKRKR